MVSELTTAYKSGDSMKNKAIKWLSIVISAAMLGLSMILSTPTSVVAGGGGSGGGSGGVFSAQVMPCSLCSTTDTTVK